MLKVGVVGVGHLGKHHARIFSEIEDCEFVGVYDQIKERAVEIADLYKVRAFSSYEEMLEVVDAVDIAATTTYHYALAKPALERGCHVFLEKPITSEIKQAEELIEIANKNNLYIQVGHIERFNPVILKVIKDVNDPMFIESHRIAPFNPRGSDVPVVLDLMIHDIDLILSFVKSELIDIKASGIGVLTPSIDIANARLEFANGAVANVTASRISMKRERKIRFFQKDAYISLDFQEKNVSILRKSKEINKILPQILMGNTNFDPQDLVDITEIKADDFEKDALTMELESFVKSINENTRPAVDGEAGAKALRVAMEIVEKIKKKTL
ncbi:MAG TPA: Gfo/Idh/MocA family oxidoreductase [Candidatus Cloacimonadota bacterium]|jgi:predicted dehydrogenase|nr:Gfo/Idh/MocA family oxidoreductase [Candidatus Cloacimonadales bacterium]HPY96023.1 Gfo/Idh/MocA family oxidoreductase [Candidatus Cloacimonadota bacterium]HQB40556.1 Gfo/Idh/MocA family oxidoreductase [Candidatus Cloacimonadota bacterium]